mgnify:CR=1 FL=1
MTNVVLGIDELKNIIITALTNLGVKPQHALIIADTTCEAELRGITSHGTKMLPAYLERITKGGVSTTEEPVTHTTAKGMYVVDGKGCFGQVAAVCGLYHIIEDVKKGQIGCAVVKNTNHCGMLAYFTDKIADEFAIGVMTSNTNPNVAAFGGAEKILGTNPFSISFPKKGGNIVIDMATTAAAKGKIYEYDMKGYNIPEGWALSKEGKATTNPREALEGIMLAFGGHKGYAISLAVEILSGVISNSGYSKNVFSLHNQPDRIQNVGFFMMGIPLQGFMDEESYHDRINDLVHILKSSTRQSWCDRILLLGELENEKKISNLKTGLEIDEAVLTILRKGVI